jgi:hypothetical protein
MNGDRWNWTGVLSMLLLAAVAGSRLLVALGVPGFGNLVVPSIGIAMSAAFGVAQYVQWSLRERKDLLEANQLKARPGADAPTG